MRKLTKNILKEMIKEVIQEASTAGGSMSTIGQKGGVSAKQDVAQSDYDAKKATATTRGSELTSQISA